MEDVIDREVVGNGSIQGSGTYAQAYAVAWAILNNIALTAYLDDGRRHGNNLGVVYCDVRDISPCTRGPDFQSLASEVDRAIDDVLSSYRFRGPNDPTDGSLQWRHIPNDGWASYNPNMIERQSGETAITLIERHAAAATLYASQVDVGGRIYFPPSISLQDVQQGNPDFGHNYADVTWLVRTLSVFNRNTNLFTINVSAANLHIILGFMPPTGTNPVSRNSCT